MSNWSGEFEAIHKDVRSVKEATKDIIKKGGKLVHEKYYKTKSLVKLKKEIMKN